MNKKMSSIIKNLAIPFLLVFMFLSFPVFGQMGYETRDNDSIKGPVRLYKKKILKDFKEKFGKYEPGSKEINQWYIYDEAGRKIFDQKPPRYGAEYIRHLYYFEGDKLKSSALNIVDINGKGTSGEIDDKYDFEYYRYPQANTMLECGYTLFGKERIDYTRKYDSKERLIEETYHLGDTIDYKVTKKYDSNSKVTDETKYDGSGAVVYKNTWKRDGTGNPVEFLSYNNDGSVKEKCLYKYNSAGKETERIWYKADGSIIWGTEQKYKKDTLLTDYISFKTDKRTIGLHIKREYDDNDRLIRITNPMQDLYVLHYYNEQGQKTEEQYFQNKKPTRKIIFSDYSGDIYKTRISESYNEDGSLKNRVSTKYDKYGNMINYEEYKIETKFGEQKKVPIEKHKIDITYYDGSPGLEIIMTTSKKKVKKNGKKTKETYLEVKIKKRGPLTPKIIWTTKHGAIGEKVAVNEGRLWSYPMSSRKAIYLPYFIVDAGDEIILKEIP